MHYCFFVPLLLFGLSTNSLTELINEFSTLLKDRDPTIAYDTFFDAESVFVLHYCGDPPIIKKGVKEISKIWQASPMKIVREREDIIYIKEDCALEIGKITHFSISYGGISPIGCGRYEAIWVKQVSGTWKVLYEMEVIDLANP